MSKFFRSMYKHDYFNALCIKKFTAFSHGEKSDTNIKIHTLQKINKKNEICTPTM